MSGSAATGNGTNAHPNLFKPIAVLLSAIPESLASPARLGDAPRYVRIARLRRFLKPRGAAAAPGQPAPATDDPAVAGAIAKAVGVLVKTSAYMLKFGLKLEELLEQGDAGKALFETASELVLKAGDDEFLESLKAINDEIVRGPSVDIGALKAVRGPVATAQRFVSYIPEPADFRVIEEQLYALLAVRFAPTPAADWPTEVAAVDVAASGKLRMLVWALDREPLAPVDANGTDLELRWLGARRLWNPDSFAKPLPARSRGSWTSAEGREEILWDKEFPEAGGGPDVAELNALLKALGYFAGSAKADSAMGKFDAATETALKRFQRENRLEETGRMDDNRTANLLVNLRWDAAKPGLLRAVPMPLAA